MRSSTRRALPVLLVSATCTAPAETGVITGIQDSHEIGCSITSSTIETGEPNNDNSSGRNPNHAIIDVEWAAEGYLDIQVVVDDSDGVTEYELAVTILWLAAQDSVGFDFKIGYGLAETFVVGETGDEMNFDFPHYDPPPTCNDRFDELMAMEDELWWRDGRITADQLTEFVLAVDVPDLAGGALTFRVRPHMTDPDLNGDGVVDIVDFLALLASWGPCPDLPFECPADLDGNLNVGIVDMLELLGNWG